VLSSFLSGLYVPLVLFPAWGRHVVLALPWASYVQVPVDIWLGHRSGAGIASGLALQAAWAAVLLVVCAGVLRVATRRVVVHGG
jgi:ABC-2 type transport system permease protein